MTSFLLKSHKVMPEAETDVITKQLPWQLHISTKAWVMSCNSIFNLMGRSQIDKLEVERMPDHQLNSIIITSLLLGVIKGCWRWRMLESMLHIWRKFNQRWSSLQKRNFSQICKSVSWLLFRHHSADIHTHTSNQDPAVLFPGCVVL